MKTKQIVFTEPRVAKLIENDINAPGENEVMVKIEVSTISSGTERANLIGDQSLNAVAAAAPPTYPRILGYSSAGIIEAVGNNVKDIKVGDRVAASWSVHSRLLNLAANNVYKIPDNVSFSDAAIFHISTFPMAAIRKCRLEMGESAIVMGMGILGLTAIPLLKAAGAVPIIAVDPVPEKRQKAISVGADYALDPLDKDFAETVKEITGGGAKVGIEVTGVGAGLDGILDCMARFGRVALLGCTRNKEFSIDYYRKVHGPGITLVGAHTIARPDFESHGGWWTKDDDMHTAIKLSELGRLRLSDMVDEVHSPTESAEIYNRLANEKSFPIVQFDWSEIK